MAGESERAASSPGHRAGALFGLDRVVRRNKRDQLSLGNHALHLLQALALARLSGVHF